MICKSTRKHATTLIYISRKYKKSFSCQIDADARDRWFTTHDLNECVLNVGTISLTHPSLVPHICVAELGHRNMRQDSMKPMMTSHSNEHTPTKRLRLAPTHWRNCTSRDDVIKWKYFRVTSPLWGEFTGLPRHAGDLRRTHHDVIVMN